MSGIDQDVQGYHQSSAWSDPSHKSQNALDKKYPTMQHFAVEMCTPLWHEKILYGYKQNIIIFNKDNHFKSNIYKILILSFG